MGGGPVASGAAGEGDGGGGGGRSMLRALGGCGGELGLELCVDDVVTSGHENLMYFLG